jgi:hypothetical protein
VDQHEIPRQAKLPGGPRRGLVELDQILRGEATRPGALSRRTVEISAGSVTFVLVVLSMMYGVCMGCFALFRATGAVPMQIVAAMVKLPALFALTLLVTLPSLYVFNALVGSQLALRTVVRLLLAALSVTIAVLASLGPIVAFFSVSTTSYPFMILLNVVVFAASGMLGLAFLLQTLHRLSLIPPPSEVLREPAPVDNEAATPSALDPVDDQMLGRHVKIVFRIWVVVFGLVGAQMGWVLRPFIGNPSSPFVWFRHRESNFFEAVIQAFGNLFI